jgi:hypothetical protein
VTPPLARENRRHETSLGRLSVAFVAGFVAVLLFHQPALAMLHAVGITPLGAYPMQPTAPFDVPRVFSLALWGGVWAVPLALLLARIPAAGYWLTALAFGALGPSLVNWLVVLPLKGAPVGGGWHPSGIVTALLINAAWGLGTALLLWWSAGWPHPRERAAAPRS